VRPTFAEWPAIKASGAAPLGQLPFFETGGVAYTQSIPISKYACTLAGLYPAAHPLKCLVADEVVAVIDEAWNKIGETSKDKPETRVAYAEQTAPKFLRLVETRLGDDHFFNGEATPMWADMWVYQYVNMFTSGFFDAVPTDFVKRHAPKVAALAERVKASELYAKFGTPE
jgi:hypothetical protein